MVIADELPGTSEADVQAALRALGEDAANALTFSISVGLGRRLVAGANPIASFQRAKRLMTEYVARVEVRHVGAPDVIGAVESIETGPVNESESGRGEKPTVALAIDAAIDDAVSTFAPRIYTPRRPTLIVEVPPAATDNLMRKLEILQQLYPELTLAEKQTLAESRERFLVLEPGHLAKLGLVAGDLLGVPGGETRATRAALARAVARGGKPLVAVLRGGQRYILGLLDLPRAQLGRFAGLRGGIGDQQIRPRRAAVGRGCDARCVRGSCGSSLRRRGAGGPRRRRWCRRRCRAAPPDARRRRRAWRDPAS